MQQKGFSLIELLVVIATIAIIMGLAVPNYLGARQRGRDARRKEELKQFKSALRLYYNDYVLYPAGATGVDMSGCGTDGKQPCPNTAVGCAEFAAGGTDGCTTVYMKDLPAEFGDEMLYFQLNSGDDFLLQVPLENASDPDMEISKSRCSACPDGNYCVCAD